MDNGYIKEMVHINRMSMNYVLHMVGNIQLKPG